LIKSNSIAICCGISLKINMITEVTFKNNKTIGKLGWPWWDNPGRRWFSSHARQ
jgi:hypothetical protein